MRFFFFGVFASAFCLNLEAEGRLQPVFTYKTECIFNFMTDGYCQTAMPKPWVDRDVQIIQKSMLPLQKLEMFLDRIQQNGFTTFNRTTYGVLQEPFLLQTTADKKVQAWVEQQNRTINFPDRFFMNKEIDNISGISIQNLTLLHELGHAFDKDHEISDSAEFQKIAGWEKDGVFSKHKHIGYFDALAFVDDAIESEGATDNPSEAFRIDRKISTKLYGVPRTYCLNSPAEHFADLVAYIFYDPNSKNYIKPELYAWMLQNVLDGQTNY